MRIHSHAAALLQARVNLHCSEATLPCQSLTPCCTCREAVRALSDCFYAMCSIDLTAERERQHASSLHEGKSKQQADQLAENLQWTSHIASRVRRSVHDPDACAAKLR